MKINVFNPGNTAATHRVNEAKQMTLSNIVEYLAQGTKPLGWLTSLSLGGLKVPYDDAHKLLASVGIANTQDVLAPIRAGHAFRAALSDFEEEIELEDSVEKWQTEAVGGKRFITYRRLEANTNTVIEAHKVAEVWMDDAQNMDYEILPAHPRLSAEVVSYLILLQHQFQERKTHYYRQHFYYLLMNMIAEIGSIKWSDNSLYFVPTSQTKGLERIEAIIRGLQPYKTTNHKSALLCVPIPDVEAVAGVTLQGGYREAIEEKLEESVNEQLNEMLDELKELMGRDDARDSTKTRRVKQCFDKLEQLRKMADEYSSVLERKMNKVFAKLEVAEGAIKKMVEI